MAGHGRIVVWVSRRGTHLGQRSCASAAEGRTYERKQSNDANRLRQPCETGAVHIWHLHFTPTSASWLNLVEGWFALLTRRQLQRGVFETTGDLEAAIHAYIDQTNAEPKPFVWTKSADAILASIKRFCQRTSNSDN